MSNIEIFKDNILKYVSKNNKLPFTKIEPHPDDDQKITVELDADFEKENQEQFKEEFNELVGMYINEIIKDALADMEDKEDKEDREDKEDANG